MMTNVPHAAAAPTTRDEMVEGGSNASSFAGAFWQVTCAFWKGFRNAEAPAGELIEQEKELREHLSECQVDKMVEDSFPASDPPSTY